MVNKIKSKVSKTVGFRIASIGIFTLLIVSLIPNLSFAQSQSHPLSNITPIDTNLDMNTYNITDIDYIGIDASSSAYKIDITGSGWIRSNLSIGANSRKLYDTGTLLGIGSGIYVDGGIQLGGADDLVDSGGTARIRIANPIQISSNLNLDSNSAYGFDKINSTNINATANVSGLGLCIGVDCKTSWSEISGDITDVLAGYGITVDDSGGPQPRVNLSSAAAGGGLNYSAGVLGVAEGNCISTSGDSVGVGSLCIDDAEITQGSIDNTELESDSDSLEKVSGGNMTVNGSLVEVASGSEFTVGGGFGSTGLTIDTSGNILTDGNLTYSGYTFTANNVEYNDTMEALYGVKGGFIYPGPCNTGGDSCMQSDNYLNSSGSKIFINTNLDVEGDFNATGTIYEDGSSLTSLYQEEMGTQSCASDNYVYGVEEDGDLKCSEPSPSSGGGWNDTGVLVELITSTDNVSANILFADTTNSRIGIGTQTPDSRLHVIGGLCVENVIGGAIPCIAASGNINATSFYDSDDDSYYLDPSSASVINNLTIDLGKLLGKNSEWITIGNKEDVISFNSAGSEIMRIDETDNVGIGTSAPTEKLDILGSLRVDNSTGSILLFTNTTSGKTGIGQADSEAKLTIDGTIEYRGWYDLGDVGDGVNVLTVWNGMLCEGSDDNSAKCYNGTDWVDYGSMDNSIFSMTVWNNMLCGGDGSGNVECSNGTMWIDYGDVGDGVYSLTTWNGMLCEGNADDNVKCYDGTTWIDYGDLGADVVALTVWNGMLCEGSSQTSNQLKCHDGDSWVYYGDVGAFVTDLIVWNGMLCEGNADDNVKCYDGDNWIDYGDVGEDIQSLTVWNGMLCEANSNDNIKCLFNDTEWYDYGTFSDIPRSITVWNGMLCEGNDDNHVKCYQSKFQEDRYWSKQGDTLRWDNTVETGDLYVDGEVGIGEESPVGEFEVSGFGTAHNFAFWTSYFGEEFKSERADVSADATLTWGDDTKWSVDENATCVWSIIDDNLNGISRQSIQGANVQCLAYTGSGSANNAHMIFDVDNNPTILIKAKIGTLSTAYNFWLGISNASSATLSNPYDGVWFTSNYATNTWYGQSCSSGSCSSTSSCGTISNTDFALLLIEAKSDNINFYIDTNTTDGISMEFCGNISTNIPSTTIAGTIMSSWNTSYLVPINLDVDFFRVWQEW